VEVTEAEAAVAAVLAEAAEVAAAALVEVAEVAAALMGAGAVRLPTLITKF
jgi:hypothetical protein